MLRTPRSAPFPSSRRTLMPLSAGLTVVLVATGCAGLGADDGRETAEAAAAALAAGQVEELRFGNVTGTAAQEELDRVTAHVGGLTPAVEVTDVAETEAEDRREASLSWTWDLPGVDRDWEYSSTLPLVRGEDGEWAPEWAPGVVEPSLEQGEGLRVLPLAADRGDILGAGGEVLVTERPIRRVGIDKAELGDADPAAAARRLAEALDIDPGAYATAVEQGGPEAFVEAVPLREEDFRALDAAQMEAVPGLLVVEDELPLAPSRGFAPDILGSVSEATAEDLEKSGGAIEAGSVVGRGGLQAAFDDRLRGEPGVVVQKVGLQGDGGVRPSSATPLQEVEPQDGEPVEVTLDRELQAAAQELLADVESPSAIVAVRPSTGELVTAANGPGSEGYSTALLGQYAPGSTFKVVTSLGMLRKGDTPGTVVQCPPSLTVEGVQFNNVESYPAEFVGPITLTDALAHSCNTSFLGQHDRISQPELVGAAAALGVGAELDLGVPVFTGSLPEEEEPVQHAAAMFGQGRTLVSPLTMANLTASVAAGELVTPRLVATEGLLDDGATAQPAAEDPLTAQEAEQLRTMMRAVVASGHLGILQELRPDTAIGKTGTAEFGDEDPPRTHSWVIAEHEDLAVAVFVEDGDLGSITGGPIMRDFLQEATAASEEGQG